MERKRMQIGFFGLRNSGKSSLVNRITNQNMSVVSSVKGTTTDPVRKAMELLPIGPVVIIDTPGIDDIGSLGEKRVEATKKILRSCDMAVLVSDALCDISEKEREVISDLKRREIPYIIVKNKSDLLKVVPENKKNIFFASAKYNIGIEEIKNALGTLNKKNENDIHLVSDFINKKDIVVLVVPIDSSAPKDRLILPQQLAIRDIIDKDGVVIVNKDTELEDTISLLGNKISLVITDSQVFNKVKNIVPENIRFTSFSILMSRYKGFLDTAVRGARKIDELKDGSKVLISEGCSHHRQCEDIGTVKIPKWLKEYTKKDLKFEWTSGRDFKDSLTDIDLVIHCGGCMLNENEMKYRMNESIKQNVPFTNYGIAISYMQGILERSISFIK